MLRSKIMLRLCIDIEWFVAVLFPSFHAVLKDTKSVMIDMLRHSPHGLNFYICEPPVGAVIHVTRTTQEHVAFLSSVCHNNLVYEIHQCTSP